MIHQGQGQGTKTYRPSSSPPSGCRANDWRISSLNIVRGSTSTLSFTVLGAASNSIENNVFLADSSIGAVDGPASTANFECHCGEGYSQGGASFYNEDSNRTSKVAWFRFRDQVTGTQGIPVTCTGMILSLRAQAHHYDNAFDDTNTREHCSIDPGPISVFYTACIPQPEMPAETKGTLTFLSADPGLAVLGSQPTFVGNTYDFYSGVGLLANNASLDSYFRLLLLEDSGLFPVPCYGVALRVFPSTTFEQCEHRGGLQLDAFRGNYWTAPS